MLRTYCMLVMAITIVAASWPDCTLESMSGNGTYGPVAFGNLTDNDTLIFVAYPTGQADAKWPVVVFEHGSTGQWEMYKPNLMRFASFGFVVVFPFVKSPKQDKNPLTTDMMGKCQRRALAWAKSWLASDPLSPLTGKIDTENFAVAGHSMGGTGTIMSAYQLDAGSVKVAVTQHPGICGPFGPPPWPDTWLKEQFQEANKKFPILMTTATNDGAFWPAPNTAKHELGCFEGGVSGTAAFVQFTEAACTEDGTRKPFDDAGHDCPFKVPGPENPWVLTMLKLYTQFGGDKNSKCYSMIFGSGPDSMRNASTVELTNIHP